MVIVKVKRDISGGKKYLLNACRYLENKEKLIDVGGIGVYPYNLVITYAQMMAIKEYFGKTSGNPLVHFIVSFDEAVSDAEEACELAAWIAQYFQANHQTLWCVHAKDRGCSHFHVHIIINSVNYNNGMMYNSCREEILRFCDHVKRLTNRPCRFYFEKRQQERARH